MSSFPLWSGDIKGPGAPENWGALAKEFAACAEGVEQSPIDIAGYRNSDAAGIVFSYSGNALEVERHSKFLYARFAPGNNMTVSKGAYELRQAPRRSIR